MRVCYSIHIEDKSTSTFNVRVNLLVYTSHCSRDHNADDASRARAHVLEIFVELNLGESLFPFTKVCFDAEDGTLLCMLAEKYFCNAVEGIGVHSRDGSRKKAPTP